MTNDRELMQLHVEALFIHDEAADLLRVNEPDGVPAPRFFIGRTASGVVVRFRHDVEVAVRKELEAESRDGVRDASPLDVPIDPSRFVEILGRAAPVQRVWAGPAFSLPQVLPTGPADSGVVRITDANAQLLRARLPEWIPDVRLSQPMMALVVDGHAVSVCCSVRQTDMAHEAGVETAPDYRGRGYASRVVAAWANAVREQNRVPLYSTSWTNGESRSVARKAGLVLFGSDMHIT